MIDNPNPRNFYSSEGMIEREKYIPKLKKDLLEAIEDLKNKIEKEEPFPHGNIDLDFLAEVSDSIEKILNHWYY